jgi:hypothetical protein
MDYKQDELIERQKIMQIELPHNNSVLLTHHNSSNKYIHPFKKKSRPAIVIDASPLMYVLTKYTNVS